MNSPRNLRELKEHATNARRAKTADRMRISPMRHRFDPALALLTVVAVLGLAGAGWLLARVEDAQGFLDPEVLVEVKDSRKLTDYQDAKAPIVDMVQHGNEVLVGRKDGTLHSYDMPTALFSDAALPGKPMLSGDLTLLASSCEGQEACAPQEDLFAVTEQGGLALRGNSRWRTLVSDSRWIGTLGKPVDHSDIALWAVSSDGRWVLAYSKAHGTGLFDQSNSMWVNVAQQGSVGHLQHIVFSSGVFWLGGENGLELLNPLSPEQRPRVESVRGEVRDLEVAASGDVLVLTSRACGDGATCLAIQSASDQRTVRTLVGEESLSPILSNATIEHAALQNGKFVVLGRAGVHVYSPEKRDWTALENNAVDAWHAGRDGRVLLFAAGATVAQIQGGRVAWRAEVPSQVKQILPRTDRAAFALTTSGAVLTVTPDQTSLTFPSDAAPSGLDGIGSAVYWRNRLILLRGDEVILHDPERRRYHTHPLGLPAGVSRSNLRLVASAQALWLVEPASGRIFEGAMAGAWPDPQLTFREVKGTGGPLADVAADGLHLLLTDNTGKPWKLSSGDLSGPEPLTGAPAPAGFKPKTAVADGDEIVFSDGQELAAYNAKHRSWFPSFQGPDSGIKDLGVGASGYVAVSPDGTVHRQARVPRAWEPVSGGQIGAALSSAAVTDARAGLDRLFFGGNGKVMSYLLQDRRMGPAYSGGTGEVRLLGHFGQDPVWFSGGRLLRGSRTLSQEHETVLAAGKTTQGLVYMAESRERRYAVSLENGRECLFYGAEAPGGDLIDATQLPDKRIFVVTTQGVGIYEPRRRRWVGLAESGVAKNAQLAQMRGHLILVEGTRLRGIALEDLPSPESCDGQRQDVAWAFTYSAAKIVLDRTGEKVLMLDSIGHLRQWNGQIETLHEQQKNVPVSTDLHRVYAQSNTLLMASKDKIWRYSPAQRTWASLELTGHPKQVAEVDLSPRPAGVVGVTLWDSNGNGYGGETVNTSAKLEKLELPAMPRPQQAPADILDMASGERVLAILGKRDLELFEKGSWKPVGRVRLPEALEGWRLGQVKNAAELVLIDGTVEAPRRIFVIDLKKAEGRSTRDLARVSWRYEPGTDRNWKLGKDDLWRIDQDLVMHRCPIKVGQDAAATCRPITRAPFQVESADIQAAVALEDDQGDLVLLTDSIVRFDKEHRAVVLPSGPQITAKGRLFWAAGGAHFWEGQGEALYRFDADRWQLVAETVLDVMHMPRTAQLGLTTPEGLELVVSKTGKTRSPRIDKQVVAAASLREDGTIWGLLADGTVVRTDKKQRRPVARSFVIDAVKVLAGNLTAAQGPVRNVLWSQDATGQVRAEWDATCAPLDTLFRWGNQIGILDQQKTPDCRNYLLTDLQLPQGEWLLDVRSQRGKVELVTTQATYVVDADSGQTLQVDGWKTRLTPFMVERSTLDNAKRRIVDVEGKSWYAPPALTAAGDGTFSYTTGAHSPVRKNGGTPRKLASFQLGWLNWERSTQQVVFGAGLSLAPKDAIRDGRFLPDAPGRSAYLDQSRFAHINMHGLWHVENAKSVRPVSVLPLPEVVGLAHGRFLFTDGGIDATTGQRTADTNLHQVQTGALRIEETLRGGKLSAHFRVSGQDKQAFARRGFLFDERSDLTLLNNRIATLGPLGLVPYLGLLEGQSAPAGTTAMDLEGLNPMALTRSGWLRLDQQTWKASAPSRHNQRLAAEMGRIWQRQNGVVDILPFSGADVWQTARRGLMFEADRLIALAANVDGPLLVTGAGTHTGGRTLAELAALKPPVAPDPGVRRLDSLHRWNANSVVWAETSGGRLVWDRSAKQWRTPQPGEALWNQRMALDTNGFRLQFSKGAAQASIEVTELSGGKSHVPFSWKRKGQMPFDQTRGLFATGETLLLATEFGLRRLKWNGSRYQHQALYSGKQAGAIPLRFDRVGRPSSAPSELLAEAGRACFSFANVTATPQPCGSNAHSLKRRHLVRSGLWAWTKTDTAVDGVYLDSNGTTLMAVPKQAGKYWPHDQLRAQASCAGTEAEFWAGYDVIALRQNGAPRDLTAAPGAMGFHCQNGVSQLGQGRMLKPGFYAGGKQALRLAGSKWTSEPLSAAVVERMAGEIPWEAARLRTTLRDGQLATHYRWQDDRWRSVAAHAGRFALDQATAIGTRNNGLQIYTSAGVYDWDPAALRLYAERLILRTPENRSGFENCSAILVEARDGTIQSVPAEPGNPVTLACQDGRIFEGDAVATRDAGAFAPAARVSTKDRTLVQTPHWNWRRKSAANGQKSIVVTFKGEEVVLSGGRLSVDDYAALAAPFANNVEVVTQSNGWWRHPANDLSVNSAYRPSSAAQPEKARSLSHDKLAGENVLCIRGDRTVRMAADGSLKRAAHCRDWRGTDPIWDWRVTADGVEAQGVALNGIPMTRHLGEGRFDDLFVNGAPMSGLDGHRLFVPTRAGTLVLGETGPQGVYAAESPGFLVPAPDGKPVFLNASGSEALTGGAEPACGALTDLAQRSIGADFAMKVSKVAPDSVQVTRVRGKDREQFLVPCHSLEAAISWALPIRIDQRGRYNAMDAKDISPRLVASFAANDWQVREVKSRGISLDGVGEGLQPVAVVKAPDAREVVLATQQSLYRLDIDQAISRIAKEGAAMRPLTGPFVPAPEVQETPPSLSMAAPEPSPSPNTPAKRESSPATQANPRPLMAPAPESAVIAKPAVLLDTTEPVLLNRASLLEIQKALRVAGYYTSTIDGVTGPRTRAAIRAWQTKHGFTSDGKLTELQYKSLVGGMK